MAEATSAVQEVRKFGHETPENSFAHLGVLSWFSSNPERTKGKTWLRNAPLNWAQARQILTSIDWKKALPTAIWQRGEFDKNWANHIPITGVEMRSRLSGFEKISQDVFNTPETKVFPGAGGQNVIFGKPNLDDKVFRLYVNPKLNFQDYRKALEILNHVFRSEGVVSQIKCYLEEMYYEVSKDKFIPDKAGNRLVVYLDASDGQNITKLLQGLADSDIFKHLEGWGEWATSVRIPLANGISFVEGRSKSWDVQDSKDLEVVRWIGRQFWDGKKSFPQVLRELEKYRFDLNQPHWDPYIREVEPYNSVLRFPRNSKMPGLLATSPLK